MHFDLLKKEPLPANYHKFLSQKLNQENQLGQKEKKRVL